MHSDVHMSIWQDEEEAGDGAMVQEALVESVRLPLTEAELQVLTAAYRAEQVPCGSCRQNEALCGRLPSCSSCGYRG